MRTNVPTFTQTAPSQSATSVAAFSGTNIVKSGSTTVKSGPNIRTASNSKLPVHGNSLSEMTVLSSLMKSAATMSTSTGMKSSTPTNGAGSGSIGGSAAAMARKEPTKRTVTNVRKAIEDAALYHGKDNGLSTQDHSKNDHRADNRHDKPDKDDYEGDKVTKKDRNRLTEEDRRMVEELSAWGDHDNDDGDDF